MFVLYTIPILINFYFLQLLLYDKRLKMTKEHESMNVNELATLQTEAAENMYNERSFRLLGDIIR